MYFFWKTSGYTTLTVELCDTPATSVINIFKPLRVLTRETATYN
jgi:hypothetical protein